MNEKLHLSLFNTQVQKTEQMIQCVSIKAPQLLK